MSTILDIADALAATLNDAEFSQELVARRWYQPTFELPQMQVLQVSVVPKGVVITTATRKDSYFDCTIDIGVQKKVDTNDQDVLDGLMTLVEEIVDYLRFKRLDRFPNALWLSIENEPIFAVEHMEQWRVFTSIVSIRYRVMR